ncbi:MAG: radical SAM family heme chaperone HemW [Chloroflexales bacterium]|nr:radical SAM family heme chaperone HemW [Chloroflexales bacterium]
MRHLYIHIPFCHRRCAYCDFNTYANMDDRIDAYVQALCAELGMLARQVTPGPPASSEAAALRPTVFLGGGTPTMLSLGQMERVLAAAAALVPLEGAEITSEANPGTVLGRDYLRGLRALGFNRLSMGVQSLHNPTLRILGRIHTAEEARQSYAEAREAGFDNLNLDFIFGLPGQDQAQWEATLDTVASWDVAHFSLYSLILEERTPLYAQVTAGRVSVPDDDAAAAMYEAAIERLGAAGYVQYEISNWVRPGEAPEVLPGTPARACHHNLAYWLNSDYIAAGAGAHGHLYPRRYSDILGIDDYISAVGAGRLPVAEVTELTPHDLWAETMMMGMRLNAGVGEAHFAARCGLSLEAAYGEALADLAGQGLVERAAARVRLTPRGRMLGNRVFERFL